MDDESLEVKLARIETKLDVALLQQIDHEGRIRKLERTVWTATGVASAAGGIVGAIFSQWVQK